MIEMQLPGFAVLVQALPIEHAIRGVAVLLDFYEQTTGARSMKAPSR